MRTIKQLLNRKSARIETKACNLYKNRQERKKQNQNEKICLIKR